LKVLHVIPSVSERSGGPGQAIVPMCVALRAQGIDVVLASTDYDLPGENRPGGPKRRIVTRYKTLPTIFFPKQFGNGFKYSRPFAQWLDKHVTDYDLIHIHAVFNHSSVAAARAARKRNVPFIVRPLGTLDPWSMQQKSLKKKIVWKTAVNSMLNEAAAIHYTTRGEQQAVESSLGLNHGVVVPLGVDQPESTRGQEAVEMLATRFPTLLDHPYILVLSRLHPKKALEVLLEAFVPLIRQTEFRNWRLVLAGEGPADYVSKLKQIVADQRAGDFVIFPGWLDAEHKDAALRSAALLALTSHHENFGLCVMEALAAGVPVLISPHVNLADEVKMAGAGWICEVTQADVQAKLKEALSSDSERSARGCAGQKLSQSFSWQEVARQLRTLYENILIKPRT
jgi:glycosyltransferase involved in cell wall biosynthesis